MPKRLLVICFLYAIYIPYVLAAYCAPAPAISNAAALRKSGLRRDEEHPFAAAPTKTAESIKTTILDEC